MKSLPPGGPQRSKNKKVYNKWKSQGKPETDRDKIRKIQKETQSKIDTAKNNYSDSVEDKLCTESTGSNIFWTAINRLLGNKKMASISPIL